MRNAHAIAASLQHNANRFWSDRISRESFRESANALWREAEANGLQTEVRNIIVNHFRGRHA
jgi:hypothetical protein